jgi:hypothetical protein
LHDLAERRDLAVNAFGRVGLIGEIAHLGESIREGFEALEAA